MARPTELPTQASHAALQGQEHQPTELPPVPTGQPAASLSADVTPPQHALDQVEHINPLGVAHLPSFFDVV
jgi:hypothetical protein